MSGSLPRITGGPRFYPCGKNLQYIECEYDFQALMASEGHYRKGNGAWSGGGPFYVIKESRISLGNTDYSYFANGVTVSGRTGGVSPVRVSSPPTWSSIVSSNRTYSQQLAANAGNFTTGWARTRPGNPTADLGQFIIELRDLPSVPLTSILRSVPFRSIGLEARRRMGFFQSLGSEYLNVVFGWKPFVNDLRKIYNLMKSIDKQIAQIRRDNGKGVRRRGTVSDTVSTEQTVNSYGFPFASVYGGPPNWSSGTSVVKVTTTTKVKSWFSACYMYYIQDTLDWKWEARARAALFGALPTPSVLWEVMPWSWLIDWFVNMGDVMSNASVNAVDNLVALYAYIMTQTTTTQQASVETSVRPAFNSSYRIPAFNGTLSSTLKRETKFRGVGSPYGLGVSYDGLSSHQKGVLAALGLSRSRF